MFGNVFPLLSAMGDGMIEIGRQVLSFMYMCMCLCVFIQQQQHRQQKQQQRCKLRVTDRDQAGTDLINRYLSLM